MANDTPSDDITRRFKADEAVEQEAVPLFSLSVLWYIDVDGKNAVVWKFDGELARSVVIGDLTVIAHELIHHSDHNHEE